MEIKENIIENLEKILEEMKEKYEISDIEINIENIVEKSKGSNSDISITCFALAKVFRKSPIEIANKMAEDLEKKELDYIEKIEVINGYVNIFLNREYIMFEAIKEINKEKIGFNKENKIF